MLALLTYIIFAILVRYIENYTDLKIAFIQQGRFSSIFLLLNHPEKNRFHLKWCPEPPCYQVQLLPINVKYDVLEPWLILKKTIYIIDSHLFLNFLFLQKSPIPGRQFKNLLALSSRATATSPASSAAVTDSCDSSTGFIRPVRTSTVIKIKPFPLK